MNIATARKAPSALLGVGVALGLLGAAATPLLAGESTQPSAAFEAPELIGDSWLNVPKGTQLSIASRKGKVTVLHFWTYGCINCKHNLPAYDRWQKRFAAKGLMVIGIHSPETKEEAELTNVTKKVKEYGITYPVLVDSELQNWKRWQQRVWPAVCLIDKNGWVRYGWEGELGPPSSGVEARLTQLIEALLKE